MADPMTAPSLVGKKVFLRPATPEDIINSQHWVLLSEPQSFSPDLSPIVGGKEAAELYKSDSSVTMLMIVRRKDNTPVGRLTISHLNLQNRSAQVDLLVDPDERRNGHGTEAIQVACRHLFAQRGLNRVYAEVPANDSKAIGMLTKATFTREGVLRQHYFFNGDYEDGAVYSMLRYEFPWD